MAGNKIDVRATVNASTILEVVIAMVLIVVVFSIAMMIFANVTSSSLSVKKIRAQAVLHEALLNAEKKGDSTSLSLNIEDFRIEQAIKPYHQTNQLYEIHLTAYDANQQKVTELEKVILISHE
jgi:type II secretory pathway pseudopilin PulG